MSVLGKRSMLINRQSMYKSSSSHLCLSHIFFLSDVEIKSAQGEQEVFSSPSPKKSPSPTQRFTHRANITTSPKQAAKKTMIPPIKVTRLYGDSLVDGAYGKFLDPCRTR